MTETKISDVFVPGKLPVHTYNPRADLQLEQHVQDFVDEGGAILTVAGPTKTGKSILLRRVLQAPIWLDGQGIDSVEHLWALVADRLQVFTQLDVEQAATDTGGARFAGEAGIGLAKLTAEGQYNVAETAGRRFGVERPLVAVVKEVIAASGRPLVIDDFHFIDRSVQREIVRALKPLALHGVPIIFVSISHRVQDVVSAEPDMTGRVVPLTVSPWSVDELQFIAREGFRVLNLEDSGESLADRLARESYGSPHLMQKFCRELCKSNGFRVSRPKRMPLRAPSSWSDFFASQADAASRNWFERLLNGPQERGNKRNKWQIVGNGALDGYGLTLLAISKTGPKLTLTKDEIRAAVATHVAGTGPAAQQTTRVLQNLSRIAAKRMTDPAPTEEELEQTTGTEVESLPDVQPVLEYMDDDPNSKLHIADPFFAFFLRWGSGEYLDHPEPTSDEVIEPDLTDDPLPGPRA